MPFFPGLPRRDSADATERSASDDEELDRLTAEPAELLNVKGEPSTRKENLGTPK
jgi:hypothetical protein